VREFGNFKSVLMGNIYPARTDAKLNIGKSSSVTLYGEAAKIVEKVTLFTVVVVGIALFIKAVQ
jgi:hypothetical protein